MLYTRSRLGRCARRACPVPRPPSSPNTHHRQPAGLPPGGEGAPRPADAPVAASRHDWLPPAAAELRISCLRGRRRGALGSRGGAAEPGRVLLPLASSFAASALCLSSGFLFPPSPIFDSLSSPSFSSSVLHILSLTLCVLPLLFLISYQSTPGRSNPELSTYHFPYLHFISSPFLSLFIFV